MLIVVYEPYEGESIIGSIKRLEVINKEQSELIDKKGGKEQKESNRTCCGNEPCQSGRSDRGAVGVEIRTNNG